MSNSVCGSATRIIIDAAHRELRGVDLCWIIRPIRNSEAIMTARVTDADMPVANAKSHSSAMVMARIILRCRVTYNGKSIRVMTVDIMAT